MSKKSKKIFGQLVEAASKKSSVCDRCTLLKRIQATHLDFIEVQKQEIARLRAELLVQRELWKNIEDILVTQEPVEQIDKALMDWSDKTARR